MCLRSGSARSFDFDWQVACWNDGDWESRFVCFLSSSGGYSGRPGAASSPVRLFLARVVEVIFGRSLVSLGCWQSQPISTFSSSGRIQIGSLSHRSIVKGVVPTTNDWNFHPSTMSFFILWRILAGVRIWTWLRLSVSLRDFLCQVVSASYCGWSGHFRQHFLSNELFQEPPINAVNKRIWKRRPVITEIFSAFPFL